MADNGQNAYLEAAFHGQAPHAFGEKAPEVRLNRAVMERGMAQGHAQGGLSAKAPTPREQRGRGTLGGGKESGDPAVTGDFETNPYAGTGLISNAIYGAGKLSENGQRQKADYDILQQGQKLYAQALMGGATQEQAAQHALASLGQQGAVSFLSALMSHPSSPLASSSAFHNFLAGNGMTGPTSVFGNMDKTTGQQPEIDPNTGKVLGFNSPPGFKSPEQVKSDAKFIPPKFVQDQNGNYKAIDQRNPAQALPVATPGPQGPEQLTGPLPKGKQPAAAGIQGADGLGPQVPTSGVPTGSKSEDRLTMRQLPAIASAVGLMEDIKQKASGVMGLVKGPLATWVGQYAGSNPVAASIRADMDNLNSLSSALQGSVYAGAIKSMQESYASTNDAPSFIRTQLTKSQDMLRSQGQAAADNIGTTRGVAVPQTLANQLEGAGIIPNGYQTEAEFQKLGPQATGEWKLRNGYVNNVTPDERKAVYEAAQSGAYGPAPDPSKPIASQAVEPMAGHVFNMYQQSQAQRKAQAQQQAAPQAAADATKANQVKATADGAAQASQQAAQEMAQPQPPAQPESINPPREGEATGQQMPSRSQLSGRATQPPAAPGAGQPGFDEPNTDAGKALAKERGGVPSGGGFVGEQVPPTPAQVNQAVSTQATQGAQEPAAAMAAPPAAPAPAPLRAPSRYDGAKLMPQGTSGTDAQGNPYATAPITPYQPPPEVGQ